MSVSACTNRVIYIDKVEILHTLLELVVVSFKFIICTKTPTYGSNLKMLIQLGSAAHRNYG